jgi:uncharacterized protein (DUF2236 family)
MRPELTDADWQRLQEAFAERELDLEANLFGADSITWRVNREAVLLLGGGRALLMQVAHPLVAAGVADHSHFTRDPLQRLQRTLDLTLTMTFSNARGALRAVRAIERVHAKVHGVLDASVGPFAAGTPYDANDPHLLLWVHATLVDSALLTYERFVCRLTPGERARYYEESKTAARLMGIPTALLPHRLSDFRLYMREMIQGAVLTVGPAARQIAAAVLRPPLPAITQPVFWLSASVTAALLPPSLRQRYGLSAARTPDLVTRSLASLARPALGFMPRRLRLMPHARRAGA